MEFPEIHILPTKEELKQKALKLGHFIFDHLRHEPPQPEINHHFDEMEVITPDGRWWE